MGEFLSGLGGQVTSFIAIETVDGSLKRSRGTLFAEQVETLARGSRFYLFELSGAEIRGLADGASEARWKLAQAMSIRFPEFAPRLPRRRKPWQSEDDRIGLFLAVTAGVAAWRRLGAVPDV